MSQSLHCFSSRSPPTRFEWRAGTPRVETCPPSSYKKEKGGQTEGAPPISLPRCRASQLSRSGVRCSLAMMGRGVARRASRRANVRSGLVAVLEAVVAERGRDQATSEGVVANASVGVVGVGAQRLAVEVLAQRLLSACTRSRGQLHEAEARRFDVDRAVERQGGVALRHLFFSVRTGDGRVAAVEDVEALQRVQVQLARERVGRSAQD